jgi:cytochrome c oxidase cbb3-type subunit III
MCHGVDGRGSGRAPDIAAGAAAHQLSDADLTRIVQNGIPSRGMPSFKTLGPAEIQSLIAYLRVLQGKGRTAIVNGNPSHGQELFFGAARCSTCHLIHGEGGFLGPDLSDYSRSHSAEQIREAIVDPGRDLSPNADTVTAVTRDGRTFVGVARNEDNFSLQLQTPDGNFHLLLKSDLTALSHDHNPLMPSDYASRLSAHDLDDLVSFLTASNDRTTTWTGESGQP